MTTNRLSKTEATKLVKSINTFFFDCDGVLWNAHGTLPGAVETVNRLKALNKKLFFVTNNSSKSRKEILRKFTKYGFNVQPVDILTTAYLSAMYVKNTLKLDTKVYMIGSAGMAEEFEEVGIQYLGFGPQPPHEDPTKDYNLNYNFNTDPNVGAVVVGFDWHFNLNKIAQAMQYLKDPSIPFIATNTDSHYPVGNGVFTPGTGCIVRAVQTAVDRKPIILGKPNKLMFEIVKSIYNLDAKTTLMVGDRLDTDILFGKNCGMKTLCVLCGITSEKHIEELKRTDESKSCPDFVATNLCDVYEGIVEERNNITA